VFVTRRLVNEKNGKADRQAFPFDYLFKFGVALCCGLLRSIDDRVKTTWITNCNLRKRLSIELDTGFADTVHELAVVDATHAASSVDSRDPKLAESSLSDFAVTVSENASADDCLFGGTSEVSASTAITFGLFK